MNAPRLVSGLSLTAALFLLFSFTACTPQETAPPARAQQTTAPAREPDPEPEPTVEPQAPAAASTTIPDSCEHILPSETVRSYHPDLERFGSGEEAESALRRMLGPVSMSTLQGGDQQLYCGWGISQSGAIAYLGAATIADEAKAALLDALRSSVYVEVDPRGAEASFFQDATEAHKYRDVIVIDGELLIVVSHTISGDFAWDAYASIRR